MSGGLIIALLVTARIAATNWANVFQKQMLLSRSVTPLALVTSMWGWITLMTMPWWLSSWDRSAAFWGWMILACLLEVPGNVLLLRSLRTTELSVFGPLSSFKPVISLLVAFVIFGERTSSYGLLGVLIVLIGTLWLTTEPSDGAVMLTRAARRAGVRDRLMAVLLTAVASVFMKQALPHASQLQVVAVWCVLSYVIAWVWKNFDQTNVVLREVFPKHGTSAIPLIRLIGVATAILIMQGCTIALFARMPVGYALALFQIGSLVSVVLGHRLFGEAHLVRRLLAASVMVVGAVIIVLMG